MAQDQREGPVPRKIDQRGQVVETQYNIMGDAHSAPGVRAEDIEGISPEFGNVRDLPRLYVDPDVQDFSPPEEVNSATTGTTACSFWAMPAWASPLCS